MSNEITFKRVKSWTELPAQGVQSYFPDYSKKADGEILKDIEENWIPYGYNYGIMVESTNTLHLYRCINP